VFGSEEHIPNNIDYEIQKALHYANEASMSKEELGAQHKRKEFISIQKQDLSVEDINALR
jgi:hypothetical protein